MMAAPVPTCKAKKKIRLSMLSSLPPVTTTPVASQIYLDWRLGRSDGRVEYSIQKAIDTLVSSESK